MDFSPGLVLPEEGLFFKTFKAILASFMGARTGERRGGEEEEEKEEKAVQSFLNTASPPLSISLPLSLSFSFTPPLALLSCSLVVALAL